MASGDDSAAIIQAQGKLGLEAQARTDATLHRVAEQLGEMATTIGTGRNDGRVASVGLGVTSADAVPQSVRGGRDRARLPHLDRSPRWRVDY